MWHTAWTEFISRITIWILLFLGRISRTVSAANVATLLTGFITRDKQSRTFMTGPSHALTRLLVDQVLATCLARASKDDLLLVKGVRVIGNNGGVLLVGLDDSGTSLTAGDNLGFASFGRVTGALGAAGMLAVGTLLGRRKGGVALVAGSSYAHTDRLVNAENSVVRRSGLKFGNVDIESVALTKLLSTLFDQLAPGEFGDALQAFIFSLGFQFLVLGSRRLTRLRSLLSLGWRGRVGGRESRLTLRSR